jgi:SAM-dependent methyltransferase
LLRAENTHFWHRARNQFILQKLAKLAISPGGSLLELGCGGGAVSAALAQSGYRVTGVDGHRALIELAEKRATGARFLCRDLRAPGGVPELTGETFEAVGWFDVLEHLDDPLTALETSLGFLDSGGYVVGTVPALMALWSPVDERAGHKTRYDQSSLGRLVSRVRGARVVEVAPFFRALVPLLWAQRRWVGRKGVSGASEANLRVPRWPLNNALFALATIEHSVFGGVTALPGASLWFALRKE